MDGTIPIPATAPPEEQQQGSERGFAAMNPERRRELARRGGKASHAQGKGHQFTAEEASAAGKKGWGAASRRRRAMRLLVAAGVEGDEQR